MHFVANQKPKPTGSRMQESGRLAGTGSATLGTGRKHQRGAQPPHCSSMSRRASCPLAQGCPARLSKQLAHSSVSCCFASPSSTAPTHRLSRASSTCGPPARCSSLASALRPLVVVLNALIAGRWDSAASPSRRKSLRRSATDGRAVAAPWAGVPPIPGRRVSTSGMKVVGPPRQTTYVEGTRGQQPRGPGHSSTKVLAR